MLSTVSTIKGDAARDGQTGIGWTGAASLGKT
jgi:hypothetical protein